MPLARARYHPFDRGGLSSRGCFSASLGRCGAACPSAPNFYRSNVPRLVEVDPRIDLKQLQRDVVAATDLFLMDSAGRTGGNAEIRPVALKSLAEIDYQNETSQTHESQNDDLINSFLWKSHAINPNMISSLHFNHDETMTSAIDVRICGGLSVTCSSQ